MKKLVLCTVSALVLAGCANDGSVYRSDVYSTAQVNQAQEVKVVRIISVMPARVAVRNTSERSEGGQVGAILGEEFLTASLWAILAGLVGIMIYMAVRFEWTFAVAAVIALVHDVVLVLGVIIVSGAELNIIHVGAILTIAGYAVNDTIVIFDRIREQLRYADPGKDEKEMMNDAINFTLSRTVLTSGSTLGAVICLYLFGGPAMRDFSATIFSGILIGTYASICVAPACVFFFTRKHSLHEEVQRTVEAELGNTTH